MTKFKQAILNGIPNQMPEKNNLDLNLSHAPKKEKIFLTKMMKNWQLEMH